MSSPKPPSTTAWLGFSIDRSARQPVFAQLYAALRQRIEDGVVGVGEALPPSRVLAEEMGLSRSTVVNAYDQLVAEGYAEGRRGSGLYVSSIGETEALSKPIAEPLLPVPETTPASGPVPFQPGRPDMRLFPYRSWAQTVARVARTDPQALIRSPHPFGDPRLRAAIVRHLADWRGVEATADQVLITAGSGDALEICIRALTSDGDSVGLENPGYQPLRRFVESLGLKTQWLAVEPNGVKLPSKKAPPKLVVLTPSYQFPMGGAMSPAHRKAFIAWAEETGGWIVEDDYDSEFRYAGRPIPAMAGFDRAERTIYIGSFSKIFSDGLRLGFLVAPRHMIPAFAEILSAFGTKASIAAQRPLAAFMEDGGFYRHLRRVRRIYADRRAYLLGALKAGLGPDAGIIDHQAGMQILVPLSDGAEDRKVMAKLAAEGIVTQCLSALFSSGGKQNGLLIGFCAYTTDEIENRLPALLEALGEPLTV